MTREEAAALARAWATESYEPQGLCYDGSDWAFASLTRLKSIQPEDPEEWVYPGITLQDLEGYVRELRFVEGEEVVYCALVDAPSEESVLLVELFREHPLWGRSHVGCGRRHTRRLEELTMAPLEDVVRMDTRLSTSAAKEVKATLG